MRFDICPDAQTSKMEHWTPELRIAEVHGRVRLGLDGLAEVEGSTLQEAGDALVARLLNIAMALRSGGIGPVSSECGVDRRLLEFICRVGEVAAAGGEPRELLFGSGS
jgi:hypothetical protein